MKDTIILPNDEIHVELINSLVDNGWKGKWEIKDTHIIIHNTLGTLHTKKKTSRLS